MKEGITGKRIFIILLMSFLYTGLQAQKSAISFLVSMDQPASRVFHVQMMYKGFTDDSLDLKMPVWTPGYYQRLDYADNLENFKPGNQEGQPLFWRKYSANTWRVARGKESKIIIEYDIKTTRAFVANPYLDTGRAYILPAGVFLYPDGKIQHPVTLTVRPYVKWNIIATGLDTVPGIPYTYHAPDYDILYDCPLLVGNLEELPSFTVKGILHRFIAYKPGEFNKVQFMNDLKRIVETASALIGDIPYKHYTFIGIGPGAGGIEHLNSTTVSFNGSNLNAPQSLLRTLFFIAHEYFHHYNVKRIRPVELGPFDYDKGSRTNLLWVSEGLSVYYEYLIVKRAGLCSGEELLNALRNNISAFENKPGRLFQTLAQASYNTWSDGPFGRTGDEVNKTISYYDKGPVAGLLFDFTIRHATQNKKSLDDVMRSLYKEFYLKRKRGFTEEEFRKVCERTAGISLEDVFSYINTTKDIDYKKYFDYAGLDIDTDPEIIPGGWTGVTARTRNDTVFISSVDWESPAWNAGLRQQSAILEIEGQKATADGISNVMKNKKPGDLISLWIYRNNEKKMVTLTCGEKYERVFRISFKAQPDKLQKQILGSWLNGYRN